MWGLDSNKNGGCLICRLNVLKSAHYSDTEDDI